MATPSACRRLHGELALWLLFGSTSGRGAARSRPSSRLSTLQRISAKGFLVKEIRAPDYYPKPSDAGQPSTADDDSQYIFRLINVCNHPHIPTQQAQLSNIVETFDFGRAPIYSQSRRPKLTCVGEGGTEVRRKECCALLQRRPTIVVCNVFLCLLVCASVAIETATSPRYINWRLTAHQTHVCPTLRNALDLTSGLRRCCAE
eukprot:6213764-Pleurochrysis_carterae.AAC.2